MAILQHDKKQLSIERQQLKRTVQSLQVRADKPTLASLCKCGTAAVSCSRCRRTSSATPPSATVYTFQLIALAKQPGSGRMALHLSFSCWHGAVGLCVCVCVFNRPGLRGSSFR